MLKLAQEQALRFARASRMVKPAIDSGRAGATLVETLRGLEDACREMGDDYLGTMRKTGRACLKLEAEKLSLPPDGTAGRFDVSALRSPELREAFLDPSTIATKVAIPKGPRIGSRVTEAWLNVLARLDACGILRLACERELPRWLPGGGLWSGFFNSSKGRRDAPDDIEPLKAECDRRIERRCNTYVSTWVDAGGDFLGRVQEVAC